ncbi:hypothetical protein PGTUg99_018869 [Puccinia graminis f. sp. tritici]|uniref:Uncharacterized protein n=1 Tax=Puccinia graminis f. sp. tritici TaxID=56615 RepID=A0A5B0NF02_PUCGR|nr:hypothetical protein PGTUg99_018869 [Puccinia graminis f. sp. tritici]
MAPRRARGAPRQRRHLSAPEGAPEGAPFSKCGADNQSPSFGGSRFARVAFHASQGHQALQSEGI